MMTAERGEKLNKPEVVLLIALYQLYNAVREASKAAGVPVEQFIAEALKARICSAGNKG